MRLVYLALGWTAGLLLAESGILILTQTTFAILTLLLLMVLIVAWPYPTDRWINLTLLALVLGAGRYTFVPTTSEVALLNNGGGVTIEGIVSAEPDVRDDRTLLRVDVERAQRADVVYDVEGAVLVRLPRFVDVRYGDRVEVTGALSTPGEFDTFSYADYLARQGVFSVMDNASLRGITGEAGFSFRRSLSDLRGRLLRAIGQMLPEPQAGLLSGILLGNERGISPELADDFSKTGASHVIAISGFNMAIVAGLITGLLRRTPLGQTKQALAGIAIIMVYTLLTGANAAVVRAAVMSSLLLVGEALNRRTYIPASLAFALLFMTALEPTVLWNISFQLSFFAVLGIALFSEPLEGVLSRLLRFVLPLHWTRGIQAILTEPVVVTLAASLTTLPIIMLYFGRLSVVFLPVNLLIVPVQGALLLVGGLATLLALVVPPIAQALYWLDYVLLSWTIGVVRTFADFPLADIAVAVDERLIAMYFAGLIGWVIMEGTQPEWWRQLTGFVQRQTVIATALAGGALLIALQVLVFIDRPDGRLHIWFLDVGHSNGVLIQTPGGAQILVDGGRFPSRLLTALGDRIPLTDRQLELVVVTQPDPFDYGAVPAVLRRYDAGAVFINGQPNESAEYSELLDVAAAFPIVNARTGQRITFDDGVTIEVLYPTQAPDLSDGIDDGPVVLRLQYGSISVLLPSDIDSEAQAELLAEGIWPLATVMQMPDHATARSLDRTFVNAVQPSLAVVQADRANRRGDPNADVLALLPEETQILRTDTGGTIHLWTDGTRLWSAQEDD